MMAMAIIRKQQIHTIKMSTIKATMISSKSIHNNMGETDTMTKREFLTPLSKGTTNFASGYYNADANNPYQQDGGYYEGHPQEGYHDEYNDQYYDQGAPAAGQQPPYAPQGNGYEVHSAITASNVADII